MSKRTIYFHEDDFCQIQLLPARNWGHCAQQLGELSEFAEAHRAPGGGWTEVYMRQDEPESIASLALTVDRLGTLLASSLEPFDRVDTGYGSRRDPCEHTRAWGFDEDCAVFLEFAHDGTVQHIWLGLGRPGAEAQRSLLKALGDLGNLHPMLLVDWGWGRLFRADDGASLASYLAEREAHWSGIAEATHASKSERMARPWWKFWT
ncbi:MAG: hypothetical protein RJA63_4120 [Pseudomonadota bacterium]